MSRNARATSIRRMLTNRATVNHPATARSRPIPVIGKNWRVMNPAAMNRKIRRPVKKRMRLPLNEKLQVKKRMMNLPAIENGTGRIAFPSRSMKPVTPETLTHPEAGWI